MGYASDTQRSRPPPYQKRVPGHAHNRVRVECGVGPRPLPSAGRPVARALAANGRGSRSPAPLHPATRIWPLYWRDRYLRFYLSDKLELSPGIGGLLREIDGDPIAIFWG